MWDDHLGLCDELDGRDFNWGDVVEARFEVGGLKVIVRMACSWAKC
jgi:hypothetical protein